MTRLLQTYDQYSNLERVLRYEVASSKEPKDVANHLGLASHTLRTRHPNAIKELQKNRLRQLDVSLASQMQSLITQIKRNTQTTVEVAYRHASLYNI